MKSRPILFSGPMVRAILDGTKTQTRRIVKPQPDWLENGVMNRNGLTAMIHNHACPYGQPGDQLWVRETFALEYSSDDGERLIWQADRAAKWIGTKDQFYMPSNYQPHRWRPSIHMPRRFSRITLEVTGVRVERLQDISEADAKAEGWDGKKECRPIRPLKWYSLLWEHINGHGSWDSNPFVWAITFKRIQP